MTKRSPPSSLSTEEKSLLNQFLNGVTDSPYETVADVLTQQEKNDGEHRELIGEILPWISESAEPMDIQCFTLLQRQSRIKRKYNQLSLQEQDVPDDAVLTPEKLKNLFVRSEVTDYFNLIGILIEELSTELIMREIVDDERGSNSARGKFESKTQSERGWLLYVTGVINNGEHSEIQRAYRLRNALVHEADSEKVFDNFSNLESDVDRAKNALDNLHESVYGMTISMRISDLMMDD